MRRMFGWLAAMGMTVALGCGGGESTPVASTPAAPPPTAPAASAPDESSSNAPATAPATDSAGTTATTEAPAAPASDAAADGELQLDLLRFKVPAGWVRKEAASTFVLAEFSLPKAEGADADGRLTVSVAGGSVEANVDRWKSQFGGKPEKESQETKEVGGFQVTFTDLSGEFNDQRGPFSPPMKRAGYRMLGAIIPVDGSLHFVKATGPNATMEAHRQAFMEFVSSVQKK